jgi:hypothetical protein
VIDVAGDTRLNDVRSRLVKLRRANRIEATGRILATDGRVAYAEILLQARVNLDAARSATFVREDGFELHVHEGRFARLVEVLVRHHRIVPVQYFSAGFRVDLVARRGHRWRGSAGRKAVACVSSTRKVAGAEQGRPGKQHQHCAHERGLRHVVLLHCAAAIVDGTT